MKVFLVLSHYEPNGKSFNHALLEKAKEVLVAGGHEVKVSDLYKMDTFNKQYLGVGDFTEIKNKEFFNPAAEALNGHLIQPILDEQAKVDWCDHLVFIFPIFWFSAPAILHSWFDRVFTNGWGYTFPNVYSNGKFKDKRGMMVCTTGGPAPAYVPTGMNGSIDAILHHINHGWLYFCGFQTIKSAKFYSPAYVDDATRKKYLEEMGEIMKNLDKRDTVPYKAFEGYDPNTMGLVDPKGETEFDITFKN